MKMTPSASPSPRSICIVVDNLDTRAGWGRLAHELGAGLARRGWTVGYVTQRGGEGPRVLTTPLRDLSLPKFFRSVLRIRAFVKDYDLVFCYDANPYGILCAIATLGLGKKFIIDALGTYSLFTKSRLRNALMAWAYRRADAVFVVSDFVRRQIEKSGFTFDRPVIMPVGVDVARFQKTSNRPEKPPYLIGVGGVKHRKGFHLTIQAFAQIAKKYPDLRYLIVGRPESDGYAAELARLIKDGGVEGRVIFKPDVTDAELVDLYSGAELFVMTSVTDPDSIEGFGMVYLEAGSCGLSAVGARDSGAEAAIADGATGLLVEHDPADIARAVSSLLDDPARARTMGEAGMAHAKEFSWDSIVDRHMVEFERL